MGQDTQVRHIKVSFDTAGNKQLEDAARSMGLLSQSTKKLSDSLGFLKNAFGAYVGSLGLREIVSVSDQMQTLDNRLKILTGSEIGAATAMAQVAKISADTNQSLTDTAQIYTRIGVSLKESHASVDAMSAVTKTLINTFRLSGSVGSELTATIVQLSQSFASGTLRGDELRSVMEQNVVIAQLLRKRFGSDIFEQAKKGMISTAEVLKVLRDNAAELAKQAENLTPTIGETMTKAFNRAQLAIFSLSKEFEIPKKFAAFVDFMVSNLDVLGAVITAFAVTRIPQLILSIASLEVAITRFVVANPLLLGLTALSVAAVLLYKNFDDLKKATLDLRVALATDQGYSNSKLGIVDDQLNKTQAQLDGIKKLKEAVKSNANENQVFTVIDPRTEVEKTTDYFNEIIKGMEEVYKKKDKAEKIKDVLAKLNNEFLSGKISIEEYNDKIIDFDVYKITRQLSEGKIQVGQFNEKMAEISKIRINQAFNEGTISVDQFKAAIADAGIGDLQSKLRAGTISLQEYDVELAKISDKFSLNGSLRAGTQGFLDSLGTTSQQVAGAIQNAFGSLETYFNNFIKTGKFNFRDFAQGILDDLQKIIVRASIVQPLANALLGSIGTPGGNSAGSSYNNYSNVAAKGEAFSGGNVIPFAKGGVVSSPTNFGMSKERTGLMGEAGPEAILPLSRGNGGKLGVEATVTPVTVNIINNSGSEVQQQETTGPNGERTIEILIAAKVNEGLTRGTYDKSMKAAFGVNRRGS